MQPDFKSVILKQFVASSPTFPLRITLDMNGESTGEIRFKATSGDILPSLANHHWNLVRSVTGDYVGYRLPERAPDRRADLRAHRGPGACAPLDVPPRPLCGPEGGRRARSRPRQAGRLARRLRGA